MAIQLEPGNLLDQYLLSRAGYGFDPETQASYLCLIPIDGGSGMFTTDPFDWYFPGNQTLYHAHVYLQTHFRELPSGSVVDVEFLLGKSTEPKKSESENEPFFGEKKSHGK